MRSLIPFSGETSSHPMGRTKLAAAGMMPGNDLRQINEL
jgi:hypothetical protein